jgi:hypothetical protein
MEECSSPTSIRILSPNPKQSSVNLEVKKDLVQALLELE